VPEPAPGQALIRNLFFSLEPSIRARLDGVETYMPPIGIDDVIESPTVGKVVRSNDRHFQEGEIVYGFTSWQDYTLVSPETLLLDRLQPQADMPLSYYIGALGGSGTTAYVGLHDIGQIKQGETVVISAAAGAVGSVAGQIARLRGCKVVGLVGSPEKASLITDKLGFDVGDRLQADARTSPAAVREACPEGVDLYFDNVGGSTLDALLTCMKMFGRVTACGMMAGYNHHDRPPRDAQTVRDRRPDAARCRASCCPPTRSRSEGARGAARLGALGRPGGAREPQPRHRGGARRLLPPDVRADDRPRRWWRSTEST
jgi:NADPH-dependent curcumin reductase CurA